MAVVDADYSTYIEILRGHLAKGTQPSAPQMVKLIAIIQNAVTKAGAPAATVAAQFVILQAKGTNDASVEIDAAETAITAALATVPTYTANTGMDG